MNKSELGTIKVVIVTINYCSATLVEKLVKQLEAQPLSDRIDLKIVCTDNSDSPNQKSALELIQSKSSIEFKLRVNRHNLGFGSAINQSVEDEDFDYICCINPDVTLRSDTLSTLIDHGIEYESEGIWGGLTVDQNLNADFRHAWQEPSIQNTVGWALGINQLTRSKLWQDNYRHMADNNGEPYPVDSISGCCLLVSALAWDSVGGFDPDFFLYSEEIDLCRRSRTLGFQPTVVPSSKLHHAAHSKEETIQRVPIIYSSKLLYASKHHGALYNLSYRAVILFGALIRVIKYLSTGRRDQMRAWAAVARTSLIYRQHNVKHQ